MAADWVTTTLGEIVDFRSGGTPSKSSPEFWTGDIPWVSAKDMKQFRLYDAQDHISEHGLRAGSRLAHAGSVLLLTRGMTLLQDVPICVVERPMAFNQDVKALEAREGLDPNYLPYLLLARKHQLLASVDLAGHGTGRLNTDSLKAIEIDLPPLREQRRIAHILGAFDDKIELNRRMSQTLEDMARALFKSWFVDFDPVRAKAEGRDTGLPKHLEDLFPDRLVDSKLGEIPDGWDIATLGDVSQNFDRKRVPVSGAERRTMRGRFPYHGATGVLDYVDDYLFDGVFLLVGEDGSVVTDEGLAVTQYVWGKFWVNNHAHVLSGARHVSTEQLLLYFSFEPVAPYVTGAVQAKLSQGRMATMPFFDAGPNLSAAFARIVAPWFQGIRDLDANSVALREARDSLLLELLDGRGQSGANAPSNTKDGVAT